MSPSPLRLPLLALVALAVLPACSESSLDRRVVPPDVQIVAPEARQVLRQGEQFTLLGEVWDSSQPAPELEVTWIIDEDVLVLPATADEDGAVATPLTVAGLAVGEHRLVLRAEDAQGGVGRAELPFVVEGPFGAPQVLITAPTAGALFGIGESVTFQGEATDTSSPPEALVFVWSSDRDGPLEGGLSGDGEAILVTDSLSGGSHVVTLEVTDEDGEVGSDSISLTVADAPAPAQPGDLVFSELMIDPQVVDDVIGEWVELYNTASYPIDIGGYSFHDDDYDEFVLEGSIVVPGGDFVVLCAEMDPRENGGVECDGWFNRTSLGGGLALANRPDEVVLSRPDGVEIDWLHYTSDWYVRGAAIGVDPAFLNGGDNDDQTHWCVQRTVLTSGAEPGTPGLPNDPCGA